MRVIKLSIPFLIVLLIALFFFQCKEPEPTKPEPEPSADLDWCPGKGSPDPADKNRLRLVTWNMENLHAQDGESVYANSVKRTATDYERMRCYIRLIDPDIMAVQEVDGEEALQRVVDADVYNVHVSGRPAGDKNGEQNTGFIYKKGLDVTVKPDYRDLDIDNDLRLRYGARIDVKVNDVTLRLMSVHLKSGCFSNSDTNSSCDVLYEQTGVLEQWIDDAALRPEPFILLGDFNRRFNLPDDIIWAEIDDQDPPNADLETVTNGRPFSCCDYGYTEYIDHIVFDKRSIAWVDTSSFQQISFRQDDEEVWDKLSDHCPVVIEIVIN